VDLHAAEILRAASTTTSPNGNDRSGPLSDVISLTITEPGFDPPAAPSKVDTPQRGRKRSKTPRLAIQDWYRRFPGVFNLSDDLRRGKPELRLSLREEAYSAGIGADAIAQQLRGAFKGITADEIQVGSESYEIDVRMTDADRNSRRDLQDS
jgi:multidrug efflux pump subunit AcrB